MVLVISNLVGQKICAFGPFRVSGAQLLFPITYIFGDLFTEVYGYGGSRYLCKVVYEVVATPVKYAIVAFLTRTEGVDRVDYNTDFTRLQRKSDP